MLCLTSQNINQFAANTASSLVKFMAAKTQIKLKEGKIGAFFTFF